MFSEQNVIDKTPYYAPLLKIKTFTRSLHSCFHSKNTHNCKATNHLNLKEFLFTEKAAQLKHKKLFSDRTRFHKSIYIL